MKEYWKRLEIAAFACKNANKIFFLADTVFKLNFVVEGTVTCHNQDFGEVFVKVIA